MLNQQEYMSMEHEFVIVRSPGEIFGDQDREHLHAILKAVRSRPKLSVRNVFIDRLAFHTYCQLRDASGEDKWPSAESRRKRLKRMQKATNALIAEWKAASEPEQHIVEYALRAHFRGNTHDWGFFHMNLEVYESALRTAISWTKEGKPTSDATFFVGILAGAWHEAFGKIPAKTDGGPFDEIASMLVKMTFGKPLNRRTLLRGIDHHRWTLAVIAEYEANKKHNSVLGDEGAV